MRIYAVLVNMFLAYASLLNRYYYLCLLIIMSIFALMKVIMII